MGAHLKGGGILVAAVHAPLGLDGAQELRLGAARGRPVTTAFTLTPDLSPIGSPGGRPSLDGLRGEREPFAFSLGENAADGLRRRMRVMTPVLALFVREWRIARRIGGAASVGVVFFLILVAVMPFALGPDLNLLARLGPAILWIAALLATLLGLDRLFQADHDDGSLDVLINASLPLELAVLIKCAAHWTVSALPLVVLSPLFGLMLAMAPLPLALTAATLAVGTPALTMLGAIGAALTVSLRRGGLLMAILVLPLTIPVLIFGVAAASAASGGAPFFSPFLALCALSLATIALAPFAAAAALRQVRE